MTERGRQGFNRRRPSRRLPWRCVARLFLGSAGRSIPRRLPGLWVWRTDLGRGKAVVGPETAVEGPLWRLERAWQLRCRGTGPTPWEEIGLLDGDEYSKGVTVSALLNAGRFAKMAKTAYISWWTTGFARGNERPHACCFYPESSPAEQAGDLSQTCREGRSRRVFYLLDQIKKEVLEETDTPQSLVHRQRDIYNIREKSPSARKTHATTPKIPKNT